MLTDNKLRPLHDARAQRKRVRVRVLLAAAALTGLVVLWPRTLNDAQVRAQKIPPPPRTPSNDTHVTRRRGPVCDAISAVTVPDAVVDLFLGRSASGGTPPRDGPGAERNSSPDQEPGRAYSLSRRA